jgi:hypothetical protein
MKSSSSKILLSLCALGLASCEGMMSSRKDSNADTLDHPPGGSRYLQDGSQPAPDANAQPSNPETPPAPPEPKGDAPAADGKPPTPPAPNTSTSPYPYAKPVPGKKGYVYSPFDDNKEHPQLIDVHDYAPGTKVRDPITQKIFIVP